MNPLYVIIGITLLTLGRKLFWLFVGLTGFVAGVQTAQQHLLIESTGVVWLVGLSCGVLGLLLALFLQKLAIAIGGFAAGITITAHLMTMLGFAAIPWVIFCGGILGAVVLYLLFDLALVVLSSIAGSALIVQAIDFSNPVPILLFLVLTMAGILFQAVLIRRQKPKEKQSQGA